MHWNILYDVLILTNLLVRFYITLYKSAKSRLCKFVNENGLVGIRKGSSNLYTLFYNKHNDIDEDEVYLNETPVSKEIANQMIKGYVYPISALLTYNAPSNEK